MATWVVPGVLMGHVGPVWGLSWLCDALGVNLGVGFYLYPEVPPRIYVRMSTSQRTACGEMGNSGARLRGLTGSLLFLSWV